MLIIGEHVGDGPSVQVGGGCVGRRSRLPDPRPQVPQQLNFQIFSIFSLTRKHERRDRVSRRRKRTTRHQRGLGERGEAAALSVDSDSWSSPDRGVSLHRWQTLQLKFMTSAPKKSSPSPGSDFLSPIQPSQDALARTFSRKRKGFLTVSCKFLRRPLHI